MAMRAPSTAPLSISMDMADEDSDDSSLVRATWSLSKPHHGEALPANAARYSRVEFNFDRGDARRVRNVGKSAGQARPPTFVYPRSVGALRFAGHFGTLVIGFRVSPIVVSTLLSTPPAEIWNEPVAFPDYLGRDAGISWCDVQGFFNRALQSAPLEHLDMMSTQLGWSSTGLRRLFAKSATLSAEDAQLIGRYLDACASSQAPPIRDADGQTGHLGHTSFAHSSSEYTDSVASLIEGKVVSRQLVARQR
jgi:hypothetical protein